MNIKQFVILQCIYLCCSGKRISFSQQPAVSEFRLTLSAARKEASGPEECGCGRSSNEPDEKIVGGEETRMGDYPWMVSLQNYKGHFCGGSVINEKWILTAAHCLPAFDVDFFGEIRAVAGLHKLSIPFHSAVQSRKICKKVPHENFNSFSNANDIALLKVDPPLDIKGSGGRVNGICLPKTDIKPDGGATVIGWGELAYGGKGADTLMKVDVPIVPREICRQAYNGAHVILPTHICAGMENKDSCKADSGGPLFQTNKGVSTIIGIVSFGIGCGDKRYPGVYNAVSPYISWIEKVIAKN